MRRVRHQRYFLVLFSLLPLPPQEYTRPSALSLTLSCFVVTRRRGARPSGQHVHDAWCGLCLLQLLIRLIIFLAVPRRESRRLLPVDALALPPPPPSLSRRRTRPLPPLPATAHDATTSSSSSYTPFFPLLVVMPPMPGRVPHHNIDHVTIVTASHTARNDFQNTFIAYLIYVTLSHDYLIVA